MRACVIGDGDGLVGGVYGDIETRTNAKYQFVLTNVENETIYVVDSIVSGYKREAGRVGMGAGAVFTSQTFLVYRN